MTKLFIIINCLFSACPLPLCPWVCVWESAQDPSHRSGALRLLIAHTNTLVIYVLPFMALFPAARGECLPPQVGSVGLASPVPRGRNRRLIGVPGCAVILLWKVFQAASQYWFFWAGGKSRRPPSEALGLGRRRQVEIEVWGGVGGRQCETERRATLTCTSSHWPCGVNILFVSVYINRTLFSANRPQTGCRLKILIPFYDLQPLCRLLIKTSQTNYC